MASKTTSAYILVMGVTGAGKSTFIKTVTGNENVMIGHDMGGCTQEVSEWETFVGAQQVILIDTPGFDDDGIDDTVVLTKIADYVTGLRQLGRKIAGVLYLHDVSQPKMRAGGLRNLEMLPKLVGRHYFNFCTLITTHWDTLKDPSIEVRNESLLKETAIYWKTLLEEPNPALYSRFENTAVSGIQILSPHLNHRFYLQITYEILQQNLPYDQTSAGKAIYQKINQHYLAEAAQNKKKIARLERQKQKLEQRCDAERAKEYVLQCEKLRKQRVGHRIVRWTLVGTGIAATVTFAVLAAGVTGGAAAIPIGSALLGCSTIPLAAVTTWAANGSGRDQKRQAALDAQYHVDAKGETSKTNKESRLVLEFESSDDDDATLY